MNLNSRDKQLLKDCIDNNKPIPPHYRNRLFAGDDVEYIEATKDYKLVYQGKARKEDIIANTPAAPLQKIRSFNSDNPHADGWQNMLIFGDNLLALKAIYEDQQGKNIFKTKNKIKLIYIDPPFATKQDFMKDREKAYRDKIIGAQFIEFLRKRLILLREILADDGCIFIHLDTKKGHYIKAVLDEIFGETNFRNEIIWKRQSAHNDAGKCGSIHDTIYFYTKGDQWTWNDVRMPVSDEYVSQFFDQIDPETGRRFSRSDLTAAGITKVGDSGKPWRSIDVTEKGRHWAIPEEVLVKFGINKQLSIQEKLDALDNVNMIHWPKKGVPRLKRFADEIGGVSLQDVWTDIKLIHNQSIERIGYPTQKPEEIASRIIQAASENGDVVLDAFIGSGTMTAVAEKLQRRWIGIDCGKLSIYMTQKRMLNLTTQIGPANKDNSRDYERIKAFNEHSKTSRGLFLVYEKARRGDFVISDTFLNNLAEFIEKNLTGTKKEEFSLICPKDKFKIDKLRVIENEEGKAGEKLVSVGKVNFLISFIQPKEKTEKEQPLKAKEFALYHAGIYDQLLINELAWETYHPFVAQLFNVRLDQHRIYGFDVDGYIGTCPAYIWPYPEYRTHILDQEYVQGLHKTLGGRAGERLYVIAPVSSMGFMEDEITISKTTYVFLKVPLSVLMALIEKGQPGALMQPTSEANVNEVIDAVGFDFISQPIVKANYKRLKPNDRNLLNQNEKDFVIEIKEFKSNTLAYDPEDFENFETLSMVLIDCDYNDDYFNLSRVFWADSILDEDKKKAVIRVGQDDFDGKKMMIIFMDKYGNELKVVKTKKDFK